MEDKNNPQIELYKKNHEKSYAYLLRGIEIIKTLLDNNFESYIVGPAICSLYLNKNISSITILTKAPFTTLSKLYPKLQNNDYVYLPDSVGEFKFIFFKDESDLSKKELHYNKKLISSLEQLKFTIYAIALTPNKTIIDPFNGIDDIHKGLIRTINNSRTLFSYDFDSIVETLIVMSELGFKIENKTKKSIIKYAYSLNKIDKILLIDYCKTIVTSKYSFLVIEFINKYRIFQTVSDIDSFFDKVSMSEDKFTVSEAMTLMYLIVGEIPGASLIEERLLQEIVENMTFTKLLINEEVTPMMVYNIGLERLLICDKIALCYKNKYVSQSKQIKKFSKKLVIESIRDLNFSYLELVELLNGERTIKVKIIMNLLLEKVINGEIPNYYLPIKQKARDLISEFDEVYSIDSKEVKSNYTDEELSELLSKYEKQHSFLVKVYLSDEKELYNLSALERRESIDEAYHHAREFLLENKEYSILSERGLI